jgi:phage FluMu protein gp41
MVSRVIKTFQVEIPLRSLLEAPTVAEMTAIIAERQAKKLSEEDLDRVLTELGSLSEEQAQQLVSDQTKTTSARD